MLLNFDKQYNLTKSVLLLNRIYDDYINGTLTDKDEINNSLTMLESYCKKGSIDKNFDYSKIKSSGNKGPAGPPGVPGIPMPIEKTFAANEPKNFDSLYLTFILRLYNDCIYDIEEFRTKLCTLKGENVYVKELVKELIIINNYHKIMSNVKLCSLFQEIAPNEKLGMLLIHSMDIYTIADLISIFIISSIYLEKESFMETETSERRRENVCRKYEHVRCLSEEITEYNFCKTYNLYTYDVASVRGLFNNILYTQDKNYLNNTLNKEDRDYIMSFNFSKYIL